MTIQACLKAAQRKLEGAGVPDARVDASLMLAHVLRRSRLKVLARSDENLTEPQLAAFEQLLSRRLTREPLQYILGETGFMGRRFLTRPPVLIPRADTEALAEQALARLAPGDRVLDLCTGSGAIAISLALGCPDAQVEGSDISPEALDLARENAKLNSARVTWHQGDLLTPFAQRQFNMICCNPPYIPASHLASLQAEVRFEPRLALDGGEDGLAFYRRVIARAPELLSAGGWLLLEVGDGQMDAVKALTQVDFEHPGVYDDGGGLPRVLAAQRKG